MCHQEKKCLYEVDGVATRSYSDMYARINALSTNLAKLKLPKGSNVGLFMPNGLDRAAVMLSLAKLGIVFFPLDPLLSKDQINQFICIMLS